MNYGKGQMQQQGGAGPGTEATGMPKHLKASVTGAKNTSDQAKRAAPDSGQTKGGSRQGGRSGGNEKSS